jgi:hypothetical protein
MLTAIIEPNPIDRKIKSAIDAKPTPTCHETRFGLCSATNKKEKTNITGLMRKAPVHLPNGKIYIAPPWLRRAPANRESWQRSTELWVLYNFDGGCLLIIFSLHTVCAVSISPARALTASRHEQRFRRDTVANDKRAISGSNKDGYKPRRNVHRLSAAASRASALFPSKNTTVSIGSSGFAKTR